MRGGFGGRGAKDRTSKGRLVQLPAKMRRGCTERESKSSGSSEGYLEGAWRQKLWDGCRQERQGGYREGNVPAGKGKIVAAKTED